MKLYFGEKMLSHETYQSLTHSHFIKNFSEGKPFNFEALIRAINDIKINITYSSKWQLMLRRSVPVSGIAIYSFVVQERLAVHIGDVQIHPWDVEVPMEGEVEHEAAKHPPVASSLVKFGRF